MNRRTMIIVLVVVVVVGAIAAFLLLRSPGETVEVLETDNGETVSMSLDDDLQVILSGNPTTGFNWTVTSIDEGVLHQTGEPKFDADSDLLGSPGTITLRFKGVAAGTSPLMLEYGPVAGGDAESTFSITVNVE